MSKINIGEHIKIIPGYPFNSAEFNNEGVGLPLIRIRDLLTSKIETFYKGEYQNEFLMLIIILSGYFICNTKYYFKIFIMHLKCSNRCNM